ncbi:hypothetical protein Taro_037397, partial [Colocasia esculenta]|nr:hypothetical protein [Colocasia esculenta]
DEKKRKEEEAERKRKEDEKKRKEEEEERKRKEEEEEQRRRKEEEDEKKRKEEEQRKRKKRRGSSVIFPHPHCPDELQLDEKNTTTGVIYGMPKDYRYQKVTKANVSTSEPIFVDSQQSTNTLPTGNKEERRDYVAREVLGVDEKSLIERFLNECIINEYVLQ